MPDLRIEDDGGNAVGFGEVWTDIDEAYAAMASRVAIEGSLAASKLGRIWCLTLSGACRVKRLDELVRPILAEMQEAGETFERVPRHEDLLHSTSPRIARLLRLGVVGLASRPTRPGEVGEIHLGPEGTGGQASRTGRPSLAGSTTRCTGIVLPTFVPSLPRRTPVSVICSSA
jgi:hypothetical protein